MGGNTGGGTGGDTEQDTQQPGWDDDDSNSLWDKLGSIGSGIGSVVEKVSNLPSLIGDALKGFFDNVVDAITSLPQTIIDGIKGIFIPDTATLQNHFESFLEELKMKFSFDTDFFEGVFDSDGSPVTDVEEDYNIPGVGNLKLKFFDTKYLVDGVTYFRPFIRGFVILLLGIFNVKMLLSFIRQDAGVVTGKVVKMGGKDE